MNLVVQFSITNAQGRHEHRVWLVRGDSFLSDVIRAAAKQSFLNQPCTARIFDTQEASEMDERLTQSLEVH